MSIEESFDRLASASLEELTEVVGPKRAESIVDYFQNKNNQQIILRLKQAGVSLSGSSNERKVA